jgi:hypothetical protein
MIKGLLTQILQQPSTTACKPLLQRLFHDFVTQHNNDYACVTKSLQLRVSLRFAAPRYDAYCKIWG